MFGSVEASKLRLSIQEYSIAQTSLEQIFNQFAAQQVGKRTGGRNCDLLIMRKEMKNIGR